MINVCLFLFICVSNYDMEGKGEKQAYPDGKKDANCTVFLRAFEEMLPKRYTFQYSFFLHLKPIAISTNHPIFLAVEWTS